ncbi:MAG: MmgE/PrpD family protein [Myxococcota bacterium]
MSTVVERLAEFVCNLRDTDIPTRVQELARHQVLNVVASMHPAVDNAACQAVQRAVLRSSRRGPCTALPTGEKLPLEDALLINSTRAMALDYDDYLYLGHTGHSAVLASWAVCEEEALSTRDLLTAVVIGNEVGGRFGASAVLGPQNGQAWSFIHALEAAAVTSRLYRLDVARTAHALAIALYQPPFTLWPGFMGAQSKVLTAAGPTLTGIQAARLAREGMTGAWDVVEHPRRGFWAHFTFAPVPHMLGGLGRSWVTDSLTYKKYPGCAYVDTTLDALLDILAQFRRAHGRDLLPHDVERVQVEASLLTVEMDNLSREYAGERLDPININFSVPLNVGIAVAAGRHTGAELQQPWLDSHHDEILRVSRATSLQHDWGMTLQVVEAFNDFLGPHSPLSGLDARDLVDVVRGYTRQMGGRTTDVMELGGLVQQGGRVARLVRERIGRRGMAPDLGQVDFQRFRMVFPARVTLKTRGGHTFSSTQEQPLGSPGQREHLGTVVGKYHQEARLPTEKVARGMEMVLSLERHSLGDVAAAVCS